MITYTSLLSPQHQEQQLLPRTWEVSDLTLLQLPLRAGQHQGEQNAVTFSVSVLSSRKELFNQSWALG